ncbi:hypothetical protein pb186bvf_019102 [Paramecium bursaria]
MHVQYLRDRTLTAWLGQEYGGVIHLTTYKYTKNRAGTQNTPLNILHKNRHIDCKQQKLSYDYIKWNNGGDSLEFKNTNHYLGLRIIFICCKGCTFISMERQNSSKRLFQSIRCIQIGEWNSIIHSKSGSFETVIDENAELPSSYNNNAPVVDKVVLSPDIILMSMSMNFG